MDEPVKSDRCRVALAQLPFTEGAQLALLLDSLTQPEILAELSDSDRLEVVKATAQLDGWSAARRARTVAEVHASVLAVELEDSTAADAVLARQLAERNVTAELSLVLGVSFGVADRELALAMDLTEFPRVARALAHGELDVAQARVILTGLRDLHAGSHLDSGATVPVVDRGVLFDHRAELLTGFLGPDDSPEGDDFDPNEPVTDSAPDGQPYPLFPELDRPGVTLWGIPPAKLRAIVAREAGRLDAEFVAARAARGRSDRCVDYEDHSDTTSSLHLRAETEAVAAAYRNVDDAARAARRLGDARTLDQLRADIAVGWLTEGAYGTAVVRRGTPCTTTPSRAEATSDDELVLERVQERVQEQSCGPLVHITVAATTMLGLDALPATLHGPRGPVPIPADLARELAHRRGARWRRLLFDPDSGVATDLSPSYRPPPRMAEFVRARDGHRSRFPASAATRLELDHVEPWSGNGAGGQTCANNLAAVGKRDHQLKTDRIVTVTGDANGRLTYRTGSGRRYVSYPMAYSALAADHEGPAPPF